jgi:hypothetical protein
VGDVHASARHRGVRAHGGIGPGIEQQHPPSGLRGDERRGAAGKTSTGDDDVEVVVLGTLGGNAEMSIRS